MILANPTPELARLRAALRVEWDPYRAWIDRNLERVNALADATEEEAEEPAPVLRAQYIFERWAYPTSAVTPRHSVVRDQATRDVARIGAGLGWVKATLTIVLALAATGCTTLRTPTQTPDSFPSALLEGAFQVTNALDVATTVNIARRPDCYGEGGFPTSEILGHYPSVRSVELYGAAEGALHFVVSGWLDRMVDATDSNGWRAARIAWYVVSIGDHARAVVHNYHIGLRPFGSGAYAQCEKRP